MPNDVLSTPYGEAKRHYKKGVLRKFRRFIGTKTLKRINNTFNGDIN